MTTPNNTLSDSKQEPLQQDVFVIERYSLPVTGQRPTFLPTRYRLFKNGRLLEDDLTYIQMLYRQRALQKSGNTPAHINAVATEPLTPAPAPLLHHQLERNQS